MKCRSKYRTGPLWGIPCPPIDPNKYVLLWTHRTRWTTSKWVRLAYRFVCHPFGQKRTKITLLQCLPVQFMLCTDIPWTLLDAFSNQSSSRAMQRSIHALQTSLCLYGMSPKNVLLLDFWAAVAGICLVRATHVPSKYSHTKNTRCNNCRSTLKRANVKKSSIRHTLAN